MLSTSRTSHMDPEELLCSGLFWKAGPEWMSFYKSNHIVFENKTSTLAFVTETLICATDGAVWGNLLGPVF